MWVTIPAKEKIGEGGKYTHNLQENIVKEINNIVKQRIK
jgi:hypothetical protein